MNQQVFRSNNIVELESKIQSICKKRIFLVRGNNSYISSGANVFIDSFFGSHEVVSFFHFATNPQLADVKKGLELFKQGDFDVIVAIGGGSALDMAKLISVFAHQQTKIEDIVTGKASIIGKKTPLIAIPTTAGSGAEATQFAVLYMGNTKYSVGHQALLPEFVYLSSKFSMSASSYLTACTGLDAFCQAVESVWNVNANAESIKYALEAIKIIWENLPAAVKENSVLAKERMLEASFLAGKAINITKTTAPHALSYAFTSYYGIPHGHAVALSLPYFAKYNYELNDADCMDIRGVNEVKKRIELISTSIGIQVEEIQSSFAEFINSVGVNTKIADLVKDFDSKIVLENVNFERLNNNPRKVTKASISDFINQKQ